uniref:WGS project CAEQ00000000 data, annotated contig 899 n=1 Tax=Trypanosoma congolense (strain IL3000) TaxID=1068625 RepID=F9WJD7_TRYCI|nr:unnamed protein product [Trypanosoma congolense IL3000]
MKLHLHSVLLMALDVVKGPYLCCFAPVSPFATAGQGHRHDVVEDGQSDREDDTRETDTLVGSSRFDAFSDIFVPRSEFCRRVMTLMEAESGLLYLFYPEEITGLHYHRKTLRYTLCFVFLVDTKYVTANTAFTERLLRPYSFVLSRIVEELREVELGYGYMSRSLAHLSFSTTLHCGLSPQQQVKHDPSDQQFSDDAPETESGANAGSHPQHFSASCTAVEDSSYRAQKGVVPINAFLTPPEDPSLRQWTPLQSLIDQLFISLSCRQTEDQSVGKRPFNTEHTVSLRLSETLSFRVGSRAPPHVLRPYSLDDVPIPVAPYAAEAFEHVDVMVHDVFKAVNGQHTIAQIVQLFVAGLYSRGEGEDSLQKQGCVLSGRSSHSGAPSAIAQTLQSINSPGSKSAPDVAGPNAWPMVTGVHPHGALWAHRAPAELLSPPTVFDVRLTSPLSVGAHSYTCFSSVSAPALPKTPASICCYPDRQGGEVQMGPYSLQASHCSGELETLVVEALQHLEARNYVRIVRSFDPHRTYSATRALYRVMADHCHPARRPLGRHMLLVEHKLYRKWKAHLGVQKDHHQPLRSPEDRRGSRESSEDVGHELNITLPPALLDVPEGAKKICCQPKCGLPVGKALPCSSSLRHSSASDSLTGEPSPSCCTCVAEREAGLPMVQEVVYSDEHADVAAAAALCALGKFVGSTIFSVRKEMRGHPHWSTAFANWEENCCRSLVEIGLINEWLVTE